MSKVFQLLEERYGARLYDILDGAPVSSPLSHHLNTHWLRTANTVGVNVRTIGTFWHLVPYAMTLPSSQNAIHILPIWEPGVVASLYGPSSWNINPEFFNHELLGNLPHLNTVDKQLKTVVQILHLLGKVVGMDVVPHTDRFSEMALANPHLFEWLQRRDFSIVKHNNNLNLEVAAKLFKFLTQRGSLVPETDFPAVETDFFEAWPEDLRLRMMFGEKLDYQGRLHRRKEMVDLLYQEGFESVPATMGPPYRGIEVDPSPAAMVVDEEGRTWRDFHITHPQKFSRVFGPLARYKLWHNKSDNSWELDFTRPNHAAWDYVCQHYHQIQADFGFDFMRGDMSHVQMRPDGVPAVRDEYYDLLGAVKQRVLPEKPWFGYFAESFLAPPGEMAYGDECDHLEASFADTTLGDLQSEPIGTDKFMRDFAQYRQWLETRDFAPNFTLMTADKDDPRFDSFYLEGNEVRHFLGLFLTDMPSYMGLGFECRDPHPVPANNEHYTKLYVFQMPDGAKGTRGPFQWGKNQQLYAQIVRQKKLSDQIMPGIEGAKTKWLIPPDPDGHRKILAWTQVDKPRFTFIANLDTKADCSDLRLTLPEGTWELLFSTQQASPNPAQFEGNARIPHIAAGEGLVLALKRI